jgi:hypothetical protein
LGTVLYEMVTGRVPFEGQTPLSIVLKHRSEPPADPQTINIQLSPGLSRIILKCLEKSRDNRFRSAAEVLEALNAVEQGLPVTGQVTTRAKPITAREITVKFSLKRILVPALIVAALVIVGIVSLVNRGGKGQPEGRRVRPEFSRTGAEAERDLHITATVPPAPERAGEERTATPQGLESGVGSAIMGYLAPFVKDPAKFMKEEDALEFNKAMAVIKEKYPAEASRLDQWIDSIQTRIAEGKKQKDAGNLEASRRSFDRGESEMRKLLSQVSEREKAEAAFKELRETKQKMSRGVQARPNLLAWIALEKEKDASDAFAKNDFSGARILCGILTRVHLLSPRAADEDQGLALLRELAGTGRKDAEAALAPSKQAWLVERAVTEEEGARQMAKDGLVPQAAEQYILAAFLYEKAKEVSLESAQAGRN